MSQTARPFLPQNYFYQLKPNRRPSTPTPSSKSCFSQTINRDRSFHKSPKTPVKFCTLDLRLNENPAPSNFSSGKLTFMQNPQSRLETQYSNQAQSEGPFPQNGFNSPEINNQIFPFRDRSNRSPSLVECETEDCFLSPDLNSTQGMHGKKQITGRDLSQMRREESLLKEWIGTLEKRIRRCEDEEKSIVRKIEGTKKVEERIFEKRRDSENLLREINNKRLDQSRIQEEQKQKNQLERKLHRENINKNSRKLLNEKQSNALKLKECKENMMERANVKKELDFSEKIIKVNGVLNFEKKLKAKKTSTCSQKGAQVKNGLLHQFNQEKEVLLRLKSQISELERREEASKARLEEAKQLHSIKFFKLQQLVENFSPRFTPGTMKGYTLASTATFDDPCSEGGSHKSAASTVQINTSILTLTQKKGSLN